MELWEYILKVYIFYVYAVILCNFELIRANFTKNKLFKGVYMQTLIEFEVTQIDKIREFATYSDHICQIIASQFVIY